MMGVSVLGWFVHHAQHRQAADGAGPCHQSGLRGGEPRCSRKPLATRWQMSSFPNREIATRLLGRLPAAIECGMILNYCCFTMGSDFRATGQLRMRAALVTANWRG